MGAPDEVAHSRRAVAVARGQFTNETVWAEMRWIRWPRTEIQIPIGYGEGLPISSALTKCWVNDLRVPTSCAPRPASEFGPVQPSTTYVGSYQPGYYLLTGLPTRWLPPATGVYAMRFASVLLVAALLASAAVSLAEMSRTPWAVVGFAAAMTPTVLFLGGSINPNGVEIAASMAVWTSVLALLAGSGPPPPRLLARVGLAAVVLTGTRPTSPILIVVILAAALAFGAGRPRLRELWSSRRVRALVGVAGVALVANVGFVVANRSLSHVILTPAAPASSAERAGQALGRSPGWLDEALGSLGWLGYGAVPLPLIVRWLWWATIAAVTVLGLVRGTSRQRAVLVALAVGCVAGPIAIAVLNPDVAWQGRYALPVLIGIPLLAGVAADRSLPSGARERTLATVLVAVLAACQVAGHQQLMTRNLLGLPNRLLRGVLHAPWNGPLSPLALLGLAGLGSLGFLALCLGAIWRQGPSSGSLASRPGGG